MTDKATSGELFGIPYNFEQPSLKRLLSGYWQPDEGMLVKKEFGVGYTLNLANWRSWVVLAVVGVLLYQQKMGSGEETDEEADDDEPVEVVVE